MTNCQSNIDWHSLLKRSETVFKYMFFYTLKYCFTAQLKKNNRAESDMINLPSATGNNIKIHLFFTVAENRNQPRRNDHCFQFIKRIMHYMTHGKKKWGKKLRAILSKHALDKSQKVVGTFIKNEKVEPHPTVSRPSRSNL